MGELYSTVTFRLADDLSARVEGQPGSGSINLPEAFEEVEEGVYVAPGYDETDNRVLITILSSAGEVTLERR
jgi:hypothetical protein